MKPDSVQAWLTEKHRRDMLLCAAGAVAVVPLAFVVLYITFWLIYPVVWIGFGSILSQTEISVTQAVTIVLVLLFISNLVTDREYLDKLEFETGAGVRLKIALARVSGNGILAAFVGPKTAHSFVKILTTLLFTGPRLLVASVRLARNVMRLKSLDIEGCGRVIGTLLKNEGRVPLAAILQKYPRLDPHVVLPQLKLIDGVVFLLSEPVGLTLSPGLCGEIRSWREQARERSD